MFAQLSLQIIYTVPLAVVLLRGVDNIPLALAHRAGHRRHRRADCRLAGLDHRVGRGRAGADRRRARCCAQRVELAKVTAIGLPVLVILALPLAGLALLSPYVALMVALFAAAASISTALLNLWHPMPGNRRGMLRRHSQSKIMALLEHLMAMLWAIAIVLAVVGSAWALVPIALANVVLFCCSPPRRKSWRPAWSRSAKPAPQLPHLN